VTKGGGVLGDTGWFSMYITSGEGLGGLGGLGGLVGSTNAYKGPQSSHHPVNPCYTGYWTMVMDSRIRYRQQFLPCIERVCPKTFQEIFHQMTFPSPTYVHNFLSILSSNL
jgi:hypothetical protein